MRYTHAIVVMSIGIIELFQLVSIWFFCILICLLCMHIFNWYHLLVIGTHSISYTYTCFNCAQDINFHTNFVYARAWASTITSIDLVFNWYLKIFCLKKNTKVLICIDYMQGELNISSTYRFMLSVSSNEELNISSLCGTRV